jgi:Cu-Zn family superoxide dismutase
MKKMTLLASLFAGTVALTGMFSTAAQTPEAEQSFTLENARFSDVIDAEGDTLGRVVIAPDEDGVVGLVMVEGLTPGEHGIHLHSVGSCDASGEKPFDSAGSHFNPGNMHHGMHSGDLGNLTVDADGNALLIFGSSTWTLDDGLFGLADADGTALVIHETVDDLVTDPSGNSGARIACAVLFPQQ